MNIKETNPVSFKSAYIIKTKYPKVLNEFENIDSLKWRNSSNPRYRYEQLLSENKDEKGFFKGVFLSGEEKDAVHGLHKLVIKYAKKNDSLNQKEFLLIYLDTIDKIMKNAKTIVVSNFEEAKKLLNLSIKL